MVLAYLFLPFIVVDFLPLTDIFYDVRVEPSHKRMLVEALQNQNEVVTLPSFGCRFDLSSNENVLAQVLCFRLERNDIKYGS